MSAIGQVAVMVLVLIAVVESEDRTTRPSSLGEGDST